jgi:hypothetical protein
MHDESRGYAGQDLAGDGLGPVEAHARQRRAGKDLPGAPGRRCGAWHRNHDIPAAACPAAVVRAMVNLGNLEHDQGNLDQARDWYQQATSTGHPETTNRAHQELRALDRREGERQRAERFGRYGYLAYADPALMKKDDQLPGTPKPNVADHTFGPDGDGSEDDAD